MSEQPVNPTLQDLEPPPRPLQIWDRFIQYGGRAASTVLSLEKRGGEVGHLFVSLYEAALQNAPELADVSILASGEGEPGSHIEWPEGAELPRHLSLVITMEPGWQYYQTMLHTRRTTNAIVAEKLGVNPATLTPQELAAIIFLHELGHFRDILRAPHIDVFARRRAEEMESLPWGAFDPVSLPAHLSNGNMAEVERRGLSIEDATRQQEVAYHALPTEASADDFAVGILQQPGVRQNLFPTLNT